MIMSFPKVLIGNQTYDHVIPESFNRESNLCMIPDK